MDEAKGLVEVAVDEGETGVLGLDGEFEIGLEVVLDVQRDHHISRCHDVAHAAVIEREHVEQDVFLRGRHIAGFFAFGDDVTEFFFRVGEFGFRDSLDFEQVLQQPVGGAIEHPDGGLEDDVKKVQRRADGERGLKRLADRERLWHELAQHDVEEGDDAVGQEVGRAGDDGLTLNAEVKEHRLNEPIDKRLADAAEGNAGQGNAELGGGEVAIQVMHLMAGEGSAAATLVDGGLELRTADLDDGELGSHKKGIEQNEEEDGEGSPSQFATGEIPLAHDLAMTTDGQQGKGNGINQHGVAGETAEAA